jgi:hypothetical protein
MRLTIRLDPNQLRQWHLRLAQRPLTRIAIEWGGAAAPLHARGNFSAMRFGKEPRAICRERLLAHPAK